MTALLDLAAIRASHSLPSIVGASVKLIRAGNEWKACCPFHHPDRSPSFTIFDGGERFHCFGCGASGDVFDYLQRAHDVGLREAVAMLEGGAVPRAATIPLTLSPETDGSAEAIGIWRAAKPATGTLAEAYLRSRGLTLDVPDTIRFTSLPYGRSRPELPCLVALVTSIDNRAAGIHRIFLRADGDGKADVPKPKLSLGRISGCAVRLAPVDREVVIAEGIEDALTLQQQLGKPAWAAAGAGMLRRLQLPPTATSVIIGADGDAAGETAAQEVAERFAEEGRTVRIIRPIAPWKDFNAELQGTSS